MKNIAATLKRIQSYEILAKPLKPSKMVRKTTIAKPKRQELPRTGKHIPTKTEIKRGLDSKLKWWNSLTHNEQKSYLTEHPKSKLPLKHSIAPESPKDAAKNEPNKKLNTNDKDEPSKDDKKAEVLKPTLLTENDNTTKLFKVDHDALNKVSAGEQQSINKKIESFLFKEQNTEQDDDAKNDERESDDDVTPDDEDENQEDAAEHEEINENADQEADNNDEESEGTDFDDLTENVNKQLHPKQRQSFVDAARIAVSKKASKEEKQKALRKLKQLSALVTLTKIAGAASIGALTYYFGSAPGAQCATFFALHHGGAYVHDSAARDFLNKWARQKFKNEDSEDDDADVAFDKLLGIMEHKRSKKNNSNHTKPANNTSHKHHHGSHKRHH